MKAINSRVFVKNMVCNRCIKVIKTELKKHGIDFINIDFGSIYFDHELSKEKKEKLQGILLKEGFELLEDKEATIINQIKIAVIEAIHHGKGKSVSQNYSDYLSEKISINYTQLSKIFSHAEHRSIEHFIIAQKIERAKELLIYGEMTLSQISYELDYSSPQHLSRQFKQVTGITASVFKKIGGERRKLDTI